MPMARVISQLKPSLGILQDGYNFYTPRTVMLGGEVYDIARRLNTLTQMGLSRRSFTVKSCSDASYDIHLQHLFHSLLYNNGAFLTPNGRHVIVVSCLVQ